MDRAELTKHLEFASQTSKTVLQVGVCLGVLITITYCGKIDYYPAGLTIGDVLFFVTASLAFLFSYTLVVLILLCAGITFSPVLRWLQNIIFAIPVLEKKLRNDKGDILRINFPVLEGDKLPIVVFGIIVFLIVITTYFKDFDKGFSLTLAVFLMSFLYGLWHTQPLNLSAEKTELRVKSGLAILIALVPLIVTKSQDNILNQAMNLVGVRSEDVVIQLPKKYVSFLNKNHIDADYEVGKGSGIYRNSKILFRGIGEYTVLEIKGFSLVVGNKELLIGKQVLAEVSN